jgi:beta-lactamase class A
LAQLERTLAGRLGVFALNTANGTQLSYDANEYFPMCSTFKVMLASAILKHSTQSDGLMQQRIKYQQSDLVTYSPITKQHIEDGMTVTALCAAAIQYSDNTASNLLMKILGGPGAVTTFARSIGDRQFQLDRWETALNSSIPGDRRDTSTPNAIASSLQRLAFGDALEPRLQLQLRVWLQGNTTGAARIRAGVPADWQVGDKTGTGDYGTANDIGLLWPPRRAPVVVAIYTTQGEKDAKARNDVIASAARIVVDWLG